MNNWPRSLAFVIWMVGGLVTVTNGLAFADTITAVSCATPTAALATGTSSCYALGSYGYSSAAVSTSELFPTDASQAALIDASSTASAMQYGVHGIAGTATAQSSADIGILFDTSGPLRDGLLELNFTQNAWQMPSNGYLSELLTIGSYTVDPNGNSLISIWIPIQLGSQFGFDYLATVAAIGSSGGGLASGAIESQISLQAFEADGTTGVQLFDPPGNPDTLLATPEPASFAMLASGILVLALLVKIRR